MPAYGILLFPDGNKTNAVVDNITISVTVVLSFDKVWLDIPLEMRLGGVTGQGYSKVIWEITVGGQFK